MELVAGVGVGVGASTARLRVAGIPASTMASRNANVRGVSRAKYFQQWVIGGFGAFRGGDERRLSTPETRGGRRGGRGADSCGALNVRRRSRTNARPCAGGDINQADRRRLGGSPRDPSARSVSLQLYGSVKRGRAAARPTAPRVKKYPHPCRLDAVSRRDGGAPGAARG